jgi:hypothetical protein
VSAAASTFDQFDDIYLGAKSSTPALDNDGNALQTGALYYNTVSQTMFVYSGSAWGAAGSAINGTSERYVFTATSGQTNFSAVYDVGYCDVYLNGIKLAPADFTANDGATVILATGATVNDIVDIVGYGTFLLADVYLKAISDAKYAHVANNLSDLTNVTTAKTNLGLAAVATSGNYSDLSGTPASALLIANNLSDLNDTAVARTNLGLGTAATTASTDYATAAQGALADSATQPGDLATVATTGAYTDLTGTPTGLATETFVGTAIANLVDTAPATLDTLNELAAALGDDPNFTLLQLFASLIV